ncbi:MAG: hypothetical protein KME17_13375 [Cyanosarcina radialis HA8281-LM2]|nr:hypothetical protein [Cyanosarcina radialis HA8281-LM2]
METTILNGLFISAAVLLVAVTGGIFYLTAVEWRNRRQLEREKRSRR